MPGSAHEVNALELRTIHVHAFKGAWGISDGSFEEAASMHRSSALGPVLRRSPLGPGWVALIDPVRSPTSVGFVATHSALPARRRAFLN
jgi:hypothetical protein